MLWQNQQILYQLSSRITYQFQKCNYKAKKAY